MDTKPLNIGVISNELGQACLFAIPSWGEHPPKILHLEAASHALRVMDSEGRLLGIAPATSALTLVNAKEYHVGQEINGKVYTAETAIVWVVPESWSSNGGEAA